MIGSISMSYFDELMLDKQSAILDYGCNQGYMTLNMYDRGYRNLTIYDINRSYISQSALNVAKFLDVNGTDTFDVIILAKVLCCIPKKSDREKLISELKSRLNVNGLLLVEEYSTVWAPNEHEVIAIKNMFNRNIKCKKLTDGIYFDDHIKRRSLFRQNYDSILYEIKTFVFRNTEIFVYYKRD